MWFWEQDIYLHLWGSSRLSYPPLADSNVDQDESCAHLEYEYVNISYLVKFIPIRHDLHSRQQLFICGMSHRYNLLLNKGWVVFKLFYRGLTL